MRYQLRYTRICTFVDAYRSQLVYTNTAFLKKQALNQIFFKFFSNLIRGILLTNCRRVWYHTTSVQGTDSFLVWRDVRAVEGTGLENRRRVSVRGFESHSLRQILSFFFLTIAYAEVPKRPKGLPC